MRKGEGFFIFCLFVVMWAILIQVSFGAEYKKGYKPHLVTLIFKDEVSEQDKNDVIRDFGLTFVGVDPACCIETYAIESSRDTQTTVKELSKNEFVKSAELVIVAYLEDDAKGSYEPLDEPLDKVLPEEEPEKEGMPSTQSGPVLPNDPALLSGQQWYELAIGMPEAWSLMPAFADYVKVGVIDTGLIENHLDIDYPHVLWGCDHTLYGCEKAIDVGTPWSHGTGIAGIIAAKLNNGIAIAGISPKVILVIERVCNAYGCPPSAMASGIKHAVDRGAKIINISIGSYTNNYGLSEEVQNACDRGVLVIAAAGNDAKYAINPGSAYYPAAYDCVMSVAGTDQTDNLWDKSNYGKVSVVAPAKNIMSLDNDSSTAIIQWDGTSSSAAQVTGLAAMLLAKCRIIGPSRIRHLIESGAMHYPSELNYKYGHGRIDAAKSMSLPCIERPKYKRPPIGDGTRECRPGSVC